MNRIKKHIQNWVHNKQGQFSLFTAILGMPLIVAGGLAFDYTHKTAGQAQIKGALDAAVLAAVLPANMTNSERQTFAKKAFEDNFDGTVRVDLYPVATREQVTMTAEADIPNLIGGIIGINEFQVVEESTAVLTRADVICILALDKKAERSIEFKDNASFSAPACSVQTNSTDLNALYSDTLHTVSAKQFCSSGGSRGDFTGVLKNNCSQISDPYESLDIPVEPGTIQSIATVKAPMILSPGVYPNGLKIDAPNVRFTRGVYHIYGEFIVTLNAIAIGNDVTFILKGSDGSFKMDNNAQIQFKAPNTGPTKGLVFWQVPTTDKGVKLPYPDDPTGKSEISASSKVSITGTAYFPTHELMISSDRRTSSSSPATSLIAKRLIFAGNSDTIIHVDHEKGGVPPLLPRSDEGSRLVQ